MTTATPPLEKIDSPKHRELFDATVIVSVRVGADHNALARYLRQCDYGRIDGAEVETPGKAPNPAVGAHIVMYCTYEQLRSLRRDYEKNDSGLLTSIVGIDTLPEDDYDCSCEQPTTGY